MKNALQFSLTLIIALLSITAQAYTAAPDTAKQNAILTDGATAKGATVQTDVFGQAITQTAAEKPAWVRTVKEIPAAFDGYSIELITVYNEPLGYDEALFQKFGGIMLDKRSSDEFVYLLGQFEKATQADDYLEKVIKPQFPNAKIVAYKAGHPAK